MTRFLTFNVFAAVFAFVCLIGTANAQTWNSDWGPIRVKADGQTFVARYNRPVSGIIVMRNQGGGRIINIGSIAAKYGGSSNSLHYGAAKAALEAVTIGLAQAGAPHNILVNIFTFFIFNEWKIKLF